MTSKFSKETQNLIKGIVLESLEKFKDVKSNSVLGKLIGHDPNLKTKIKDLMKEINLTIKDYSNIDKKEFDKLHKKYTAHIKQLPKREKRKGLPELKEVDKKYGFRFAPSPSGPMHVGHAIPILLNSEYAKKYNGKFVLRIEDTNPNNIDKNAYEDMVEDIKWLTNNNIAEVIIQSDKLNTYYKYAEQIISQGNAYVCTCSGDHFREFVKKKTECPCRNHTPEENKKKWDSMQKDWKDGSAVLRIKTDMKHKNPAIRDWPAFRITEDEHPRQGKKYRVWPLMNFSTAVDDHESQLTHIIRGKDHLTNAERQEYIYKYLDWWIPEYLHTGRVNFEGINISATELQKEIEENKYSGRDDPKLPTIAAFKRRGLSPEPFIQYVHELGPSKVDKTVKYEEFMKAIYAFNRSIIEEKANRYFIIEDPIETEIINLPSNIKAEMPLHPNFPERGTRKFHKTNKVYIEKRDTPIKTKNYRLMHLCNFSGKDYKFISKNPDSELKTKAIHWLPISDKEKLVKIKVLMSHRKDIEAVGEPSIKHIKVGEIVQFERKFFAKLDSKEGNNYIFCQTNK